MHSRSSYLRPGTPGRSLGIAALRDYSGTLELSYKLPGACTGLSWARCSGHLWASLGRESMNKKFGYLEGTVQRSQREGGGEA